MTNGNDRELFFHEFDRDGEMDIERKWKSSAGHASLECKTSTWIEINEL
jgi:hypothetical protein